MLSKINETTFQQFTWSIEKSRKDAQISQRLSIIGPILWRQEVCPVEWNSEHPPRLEQIEELFLIPSIAFLSTPVCNNNPFVAAGIAAPLSLAFYSTPSLPFWQWVSSFLGQFGEVSIYDQARGCNFATTALFCSACVLSFPPSMQVFMKEEAQILQDKMDPPSIAMGDCTSSQVPPGSPPLQCWDMQVATNMSLLPLPAFLPGYTGSLQCNPAKHCICIPCTV